MKELREVIEGTKFTLGLGNRELGQHLGFGRRYIDKVLREGVTTQKQAELIERINQLDFRVTAIAADDSDKIKGLEHQVVMLQKDNDYFVKTNAELRKQIGVAVKDCGKVRIENGDLIGQIDEAGKLNADLKNECAFLESNNDELADQLRELYADLSEKGEQIAEKNKVWLEQWGISEKLRERLQIKNEVIGNQFEDISNLEKKEENLSWLCFILAVCWIATVVFYQVF